MTASAGNDLGHAGTIWAINLDEPRPAVVPRIPVEFGRLRPEQIDQLAHAMGDGVQAEVLRRIDAGKRCYVARAGDQIAAYGWVSLLEEHIGEFNLRVRLVPGEAYIWDCFTVPEYRRFGLYSALLIHILHELQSDGLCRAWIGADLDNLPSQRGIARAGFHPVADMLMDRVLAVRSVWVQGRPDVPEGAVAEARRVFLDNRDSVWLKAVQALNKPDQAQLHPNLPRDPTDNRTSPSDNTLPASPR